MIIPKFWAKQAVPFTSGAGDTFDIAVWRWSDSAQEDAAARAKEAAADLARRLQSGEELSRYSYGEQPLREEVLRELGTAGAPSCVLTRNRYGAVVLNSPKAMFVDIDLPESKEAGWLSKLAASLFSKKTPPAPSPQEAAVKQIEEAIQGQPRWGARVYRTFAGLRILFTHDVFDPKSKNTEALMTSLGADPLYVRLCRNQECFRARLSPKPWRLGLANPPAAYPYPEGALKRHSAWVRSYEEASRGHAVCKMLRQIGNTHLHPDVAEVVKIHDELCRIREDLPLA